MPSPENTSTLPSPLIDSQALDLLDKKSALEIFGEEGLPKDAGGQLETYIHPPSKCPSADEYVNLYNLPKQVVKKSKERLRYFVMSLDLFLHGE